MKKTRDISGDNPRPASPTDRTATTAFPLSANASPARPAAKTGNKFLVRYIPQPANDAAASGLGNPDQERTPMKKSADITRDNPRPASPADPTARTAFPLSEKTRAARPAAKTGKKFLVGYIPVATAINALAPSHQEPIDQESNPMEGQALQDRTDDSFEGDASSSLATLPPTAADYAAEVVDEVTVEAVVDTETPRMAEAVGLPDDFDYRELKPGRYGTSLPALDAMERRNLENSIVRHGLLSKIVIDEWLNVIDGNNRLEICLEHGITPVVEMVSGLSDEEKEELALSCNLDRRQLKDPDVERQVLQARFENLCLLREKDPKKWPQQKIADLLHVSLATVSVWERNRHSSSDGDVSKPDARRKYNEDIECEAIRMIREGMPQTEVARKLLMNPKAVQRAVNKEKRRESREGAAKEKGAKAATEFATEPVPPRDGISWLHRLALEHLGQDFEAYAGLLESAVGKACEGVKVVQDDVAELLNLSLYASHMAAAADLRLREILGDGESGAVVGVPSDEPEPDTDSHQCGGVHLGSVLGDAPDGIFVSLPGGRSGVIDNGDMSLLLNGRPAEGDTVRVRVEGFDPERGLAALKLLGRQTFTRTDSPSGFSRDPDERSTPYAEFPDRSVGPQLKEVI
jgi:DNA-binding transcriptional regulator YiaG